MTGAELLAESSCSGTAGINVEACTEIGGAILCVLVVVISDVGTSSMSTLGPIELDAGTITVSTLSLGRLPFSHTLEAVC